MPLQATAGAATYDAFGGGVTAAKYIEDYFQTWLRTGTGASATVTTGINASLNKSLVWTKSRSAATAHKLTDTVRGATKGLISNTTGAETTDTNGLTAFSSTGYTIGTDTNYNNSGATYVDWQWAATPKFFDVVTWTGDGTTPRTISHTLGSTPGCIIVKNTYNGSTNWVVWHRSLGSSDYLLLNSTNASATNSSVFPAAPTATTFTVGAGAATSVNTNLNTETYVAYLFAHDAGGFGAGGTDNVISCGSFTTDGSGNASVTLGYEPQWVMVKSSSDVSNWAVTDSMRGMTVSSAYNPVLVPNSSAAENTTGESSVEPTATGFYTDAATMGSSRTYIYIAIRRGPMRVPTSGTSVYNAIARTGTGATATVTGVGFPPDLMLSAARNVADSKIDFDRLRGAGRYIYPNLTDAEGSSWPDQVTAFGQDGVSLGADATQGLVNLSGRNYINWFFQRAPGFFDVVCVTGTGSGATYNHNLGVVPELMIQHGRSLATDWECFTPLGKDYAGPWLNKTNAASVSANYWIAPTSTTFKLQSSIDVNGSTYVAYLFATVAGVSKVGSYTGTGTTLQVNCGFTAGARFVLVKATSTTGDWLVWDSARGIVAGNDPYLALNSTAAEVTTTDWVDTYSAGFELSSAGGNLANTNGTSYIFLAVA